MANIKFSALPGAAAVGATDVIVGQQSSVSVLMTALQLRTYIINDITALAATTRTCTLGSGASGTDTLRLGSASTTIAAVQNTGAFKRTAASTYWLEDYSNGVLCLSIGNGTTTNALFGAATLVQFPYTYTAGGTTGNQTINKQSGSVNIAAAGTTVTVTNSMVTTTSIVIPVIRTADATARITNVVVSNGSFVINIVAATGETRIDFVVLNGQ